MPLLHRCHRINWTPVTRCLRLPLLAAICFQAAIAKPGEEADDKQAAADRLEYMKRSAAVYRITLDDETKTELALDANPALRWNNPVSGVPDGSLFLWVGPNGRPELAAQVFIAANTKDLWLHEFQSLSLGRFAVVRDAGPLWSPRRPGVEMKPVPGAPRAAETAVARLAQMRSLAKDFEANDEFEGKSRWELRLLSKPLMRYNLEQDEILDGALFAFAHGTDPEVFLLLEARRVSIGHAWQYGLAPMTAYGVKASYKQQPIWDSPARKPPFDPEEPYFILKYVP